MLITAKTFDGNDIQDSDYAAVLLNPSTLPGAKPVFIDQPQEDSEYSGAYTVDVRSVALSVQIVNYADRHALLAQLKKWFKRGTQGDMVATFEVDGKDYLLPCVVVTPPASNGSWYFTIILQTGATAWRAVTADTDTWNATGTGGTHTLTVEGDDDTLLSAVLTPTVGPSTRYLYQNIYRLVPPSGITYGMRTCIVQLDTTGLVSGGKMQADCDDLRVFVGDLETPRWIDAPNTNHTKVEFNVNLLTGASLILKTAVASSGAISYLQFNLDKAHTARLSTMPNEGIVYHGTEWFAYSGRDAKLCRLTVKTRGVLGTALQAHSAADVFWFIPAPIRLLYGNSAAVAPSLSDDHYDDTKPLIKLADSTDALWVWDSASLFTDPAHPNRPCGWTKFMTRQGNVTDDYTQSENVEGAAPALGAQIGAWLKGSVVQKETAALGWKFYSPGGIQTVSMTGSKWRNAAAWPAIAALQYLKAGSTTPTTAWNEATPASASSWTAWTHTAVSITDTAVWLQLIFSGTLAAIAGALAMFEGLTASVAFKTANIPAGALLGETSNYSLDVTLANNENDDALELIYPMLLNKAFTLDGEAFTAQYEGVSAVRALSLTDPGRSAWIRLKPGSNELAVSSTDLGHLTLSLSYYRRRL